MNINPTYNDYPAGQIQDTPAAAQTQANPPASATSNAATTSVASTALATSSTSTSTASTTVTFTASNTSAARQQDNSTDNKDQPVSDMQFLINQINNIQEQVVQYPSLPQDGDMQDRNMFELQMKMNRLSQETKRKQMVDDILELV
jgi:hypothetical protein